MASGDGQDSTLERGIVRRSENAERRWVRKMFGSAARPAALARAIMTALVLTSPGAVSAHDDHEHLRVARPPAEDSARHNSAPPARVDAAALNHGRPLAFEANR